MNSQPDLDELDRALSQTAPSTAAFHPGQPRRLSWSSRLRRSWDRHGSLVSALILLGLMALALMSGSGWNWFYLLPLLKVADRLAQWREESRSSAPAEELGEYLPALRTQLEQRLSKEAFDFALLLALAIAVALLVPHSRHPIATAVVCAALVAIALLRWALFLPGLRRELEDLGGDTRRNWILNVILICLGTLYLLAVPLIWLCHRLHDLWLRLTNRRSAS